MYVSELNQEFRNSALQKIVREKSRAHSLQYLSESWSGVKHMGRPAWSYADPTFFQKIYNPAFAPTRETQNNPGLRSPLQKGFTELREV